MRRTTIGGTSAEMARPTALGIRVRELREERELTQADLAIRARLDVSTLSRIELGKQIPSTETVEFLASALGVHPGQLLGISDAKVDYELDHDPDIKAPLAEYLSSPRGRTTPAHVASRIGQPSIYRALGISKPEWEDFEDLRRLFERRLSGSGDYDV